MENSEMNKTKLPFIKIVRNEYGPAIESVMMSKIGKDVIIVELQTNYKWIELAGQGRGPDSENFPCLSIRRIGASNVKCRANETELFFPQLNKTRKWQFVGRNKDKHEFTIIIAKRDLKFNIVPETQIQRKEK
jgi:hypothetical protein